MSRTPTVATFCALGLACAAVAQQPPAGYSQTGVALVPSATSQPPAPPAPGPALAASLEAAQAAVKA